MREGKMVVLSPVGGNLDFNKANNILFHHADVLPVFNKEGIRHYGDMNRLIYEQHFSADNFIHAYQTVINKLIG
ncbi:hypothetical protein [Enterobacter ludwigii]|uniref:hypothetical protein n=1 Tax=Enterobacter ludwigii TaxID=299767 RepID=UPI003F71C29D